MSARQLDFFIEPKEEKKKKKKVLDTQIEGYNKVLKDLGTRQAAIFGLACKSGSKGVTIFELCSFLALPPNSVSGRISELVEAGKLKDSSRRRINPMTGVNGVVWVVA